MILTSLQWYYIVLIVIGSIIGFVILLLLLLMFINLFMLRKKKNQLIINVKKNDSPKQWWINFYFTGFPWPSTLTLPVNINMPSTNDQTAPTYTQDVKNWANPRPT